jgi:hypothetical protein
MAAWFTSGSIFLPVLLLFFGAYCLCAPPLNLHSKSGTHRVKDIRALDVRYALRNTKSALEFMIDRPGLPINQNDPPTDYPSNPPLLGTLPALKAHD